MFHPDTDLRKTAFLTELYARCPALKAFEAALAFYRKHIDKDLAWSAFCVPRLDGTLRCNDIVIPGFELSLIVPLFWTHFFSHSCLITRTGTGLSGIAIHL